MRTVASESFFFEYLNDACNIDVDVIHPVPTEEDHIFKLYKNAQEPKKFALVAGQGLSRMINSERPESVDIISQILTIKENDPEGIISFLKENGHLFPIMAYNGSYSIIPIDTISRILARIRATVMLMSAISNTEKNYFEIAGLTLFLLFDDDIRYEDSFGNLVYQGCKHRFSLEMERISLVPEIDGEIDSNIRGYFDIPDTVMGPSFHLDSKEYMDIMDGGYLCDAYPGISDLRFHDIVYLYRNLQNADLKERIVIDFVFHFMHEVGVIEKVSSDGSIIPYGQFRLDNFSPIMKAKSIEVAAIILDEELNANLSGITPYYDTKKMEPSWQAKNLLSAIYFSIFFMRPGIEMYRKCANPNCRLPFIVKTTSTRRKYCSPECSNAMAQRNYRKRQKEKRIHS